MEEKKEKNMAEKRSSEVLASFHNGEFTKDDTKVELIEINEAKEGVQILARAWKNGKPVGFGDGTVEIERFNVYNPPTLVLDPQGDIVIESYDPHTKISNTRRFRKDPLRSVVEDLRHTISLVGKDGGDIINGKVGNTVSTFYPAAGANTPVNGIASREGQNETWAAVLAGVGTNASVDPAGGQSTFTLATSTTDQYWGTINCFFLFDTSTIPDTDVISSATLSTFGEGKSAGIGSPVATVVASSPANTNNIVAADYGTAAKVSFGSVPYASYSTSAYNDFVLNASGIANISKTGISKFAVTNDWWVSGSPTWADGAFSHLGMFFAAEAGTTQDPKLVVTHAAPVINNLTTLNVG